MPDANEQSPASAVLMLEGLAWALEHLPPSVDTRDLRARALTAKAARDAARAAVDQHQEWSAAQLVAARDSGVGEWQRDILRALLGADHAHQILRRHPCAAHEGDGSARISAPWRP